MHTLQKKIKKKNNFDSICIGFEKLNIFSKKITNYLELSKLCGRIGEKNFIIVGGMAIQEAVIDWGGGQQGPL